MAISLTVKINGDTVDAISASIQPKSLNQGHQTFVVILDNLANKYGGLYHAADIVEIYLGEIVIFSGIIDSIKHQLSCNEKWDWMDYLRIAGRDYSFQLAGYKYTAIWPATMKFGYMITEAIEESGCPLQIYPNIEDSVTVGGHSIQDGYLLDLARELLAKANWFGEVKLDDGDATLFMRPPEDAEFETGITLTDVLGIPNLIEEDGLEIRNYIEVLGAAILKNPADMDAWTEAITDWTGATLSNDHIPDFGAHSIKGNITADPEDPTGKSYSTFYLEKSFNLLYGQNNQIKFTTCLWGVPIEKKIRLKTTEGDYFEADITASNYADWSAGFNALSLGPDAEISEANPDGTWAVVGNPNWFDITAIEFYVHFNNPTSYNPYLEIDGLFLYPMRPRGFAEDAVTSQPTYGKREITIIKDDLTTAEQVQAEADSQLEKLKDPATFIPHIIARGSDFIVDGEFLALPARLIDLDLPNLEFLDGTYRMENIVITIAPYQNLAGGYDFIVEFDGVSEAAKVDADAFEKITKGRVLPVIKQLARNEYGF